MRISDWSSDVCSSDLGAPAWWVTGQALDLLLALAHFIASRPGSMAMLPVFPEWTFALVVFGGLWISLWRSGARYYGLVPLLMGLAFMASSTPPDLLVTGDGRHLAVQVPGGGLAILRARRSEEHTSELQSLMRISY